MEQIIYQEIENDKETWKTFFSKLPVEQIKIIDRIGKKIWIDRATGFVLANKKYYVLGYTTKTNLFYDTNRLNPYAINPYTSNEFYVSRRTFHKALMWRIDVLDRLETRLTDTKWYEIGRRCLFQIYMDLDMSILYQRELQLVRKLKSCNREFFDKIVKGDFYKRMYDLYHNYTYKEHDFNYSDYVMSKTYKWKQEV